MTSNLKLNRDMKKRYKSRNVDVVSPPDSFNGYIKVVTRTEIDVVGP